MNYIYIKKNVTKLLNIRSLFEKKHVPEYSLGSPYSKGVSGMGVSCVVQLHDPWTILGGSGQELPSGLG